jgi:hypothetical protein
MKSKNKIQKSDINNEETEFNQLTNKRKREKNEKPSNPNSKKLNNQVSQTSNLMSVNSDGAIIINKKEVWDIVRHINDEEFKIFKKKDTEDLLSEPGSLNSETQNLNLINKQPAKMMIKRPPSPSQERDQRLGVESQSHHPSLNDAGSGSITEMVKTEESPPEKQNILKMILGDIHHCQYSEIFKIFTREINDPTTLDYFIKLKESMAKEDTERLLNMLVFIVWSLRFMKIDSSLVRNTKNLMVISNSFMIRGDTDSNEQDKPPNFFSSSDSSNSHQPEPFTMEYTSEGPGHLDNLNNFHTPNFFSFNQACQPFNINCHPVENLPTEEKKNSGNSGKSPDKSKIKITKEESHTIKKNQENEVKYNVPVQSGVINNQMLAIPLQGPNGAYFIPVPISYFQGNLNLPINTMTPITSPQNQFFIQPANLNTMPSNFNSSHNTSSFFRTEVVTSGQLQYNFASNEAQSNPPKRQGTYDQFTLNDSNNNNNNNTLSSIISKGNNNSNQTSTFVKKEPDFIDITVGEDKQGDEDFERVYKEIVGIFSKSITEKTFVDLRKFMYESQAKKIEDVIRKNPFSYLDKKQYILLFRTSKEELYLKIDPQEKKYSIFRSTIRKSTSTPTSKK